MTDWSRLFSIAVLEMGLRPRDFWALDHREWRWLMTTLQTRHGDNATSDRASLAALMKQYPDEKRQT